MTQKKIEVRAVEHAMVNWFSPAQLIPIALRSMLGTVFGSYTDRREIQAALSPQAEAEDSQHLDFSAQESLWFDYVADMGDGWNATASMAWLVSRDALDVSGERLPRGDLLVLGGDEVYPIASREAYAQRFITPCTSALPWTRSKAQTMLALPGNHDWYDGLTSFLRVFCQRRWIGGRMTMQSRSYFAVKLPQRWWLWAIDVQLETDIDAPQRDYFLHFAEKLQPGDKLILCVPTPEWVGRGDARNEEQETPPYVSYLEGIVRRTGAQIRVYLTGDSHHYAHYVPQTEGAPHRITAGGGGAFLHGTQEQPDVLKLRNDDGSDEVSTLQATYPERAHSRSMRWRNLLFCLYNPSFSALLGAVYVLLTWAWYAASTPVALFVSLLPVAGFYLFASVPLRPGAAFKRFLWGALHGAAHVGLAITSCMMLHAFFAGSASSMLNWIAIFFAGSVLGGTLFGLYLVLSSTLAGMHENDVFASLHHPHLKNFLRMRIDEQGLHIHPLKVERVCTRWQPAAHVEVHEKPSWWARRFGLPQWKLSVEEQHEGVWFEPQEIIATEMIEAEPIHIP